MRGRAFLAVARDLPRGPTEAHWRAAAVNAHYALLLECRDALAGWGRTAPHGPGVHAFVRLRLTYARDRDVKDLGLALEELVRDRNAASYDLRTLAEFASPSVPTQRVQQAENALAVLDAIEADPARRAAAIATLPP
jgi:hypothetical protein